MAREPRRDASIRRWLLAAVLAAVAMLGWLSWHAFEAATTLGELRRSHAQAAQAHDAMLRLEAEVQRTAQLAMATGRPEWLARHMETEESLRQYIGELRAGAGAHDGFLAEALSALDAMSRLEQQALALQAAGQGEAAFELVTSPRYSAQLLALGSAIRRFDDTYHGWMLEQSLGLTQGEVVSLLGAMLLFGIAIGAWVLLVRRLRGEQAALLQEMEARGRAEAELLRAQKFEVLGELSGTVAHDVDNMLSAVAGYTSLAGKATSEQTRQTALEGLERAVRHGRGLTRNLMSFVRHEQAALQPVELGAMVEQARAWLAPLLPENIVLRVVNHASGPLWVDADAINLEQAVLNLALNARDAMPDGGELTLALCRRQHAHEQGGDRTFPLACIGVKDTGCGMDEATLRRAREPFFSTKPSGKGTGLGLVSAGRIVESMGGTLDIESAPGAGTHVRLLLPERPEFAVAAPDAPSGSPRVTLVSSRPFWGELLAGTLEDQALSVARHGRLADAWPDGGPTALLVLDWSGSVADVVAQLKTLRAAGFRAPVLLLLDSDAVGRDTELESELAGLALVVSRGVQLGELGNLARRLVAAPVPGTAA
jgi:signal transduction histidine kinase